VANLAAVHMPREHEVDIAALDNLWRTVWVVRHSNAERRCSTARHLARPEVTWR
jgi:hypothetical protein